LEYLSKDIRLGFREACVDLSLSQIDSIFEAAGLVPGEIPNGLPVSGARRGRVEEYYANVEWSNLSHVKKIVRVINLALSQSYLGDADKQSIRDLCQLGGLVIDGPFVRLDHTWGVDLLLDSDGTFDREQFSRYCDRMQQALADDPEAAIGSAKELLEAAAHYVLREGGESVASRTDFPKLVKQALSALELSAENIEDSAKGAAAIRRVLAAFSQIVEGLGRLRNLYGTGHGRARRTAIQPRHAKLAVGAAITLATFMLETLDERENSKAKVERSAT
jgi:hypothetical protein